MARKNGYVYIANQIRVTAHFGGEVVPVGVPERQLVLHLSQERGVPALGIFLNTINAFKRLKIQLKGF